jgi:HSP20 family protein
MVETTQPAGFWPHLYEPLRNFGSRLAQWLSPASEASSDETVYRIAVELPGVAEKDIHLSATRDTLTVSGEKSQAREEEGETWYFSERQYGAFRRVFRLPADADGERAEARVADGVLEVTIPRQRIEERSGKKIEVKKA